MTSIGVISGDGTGPEVIAQAKKVLDAAGKKHNIKLSFTDLPVSANRYLKEGKTLSDDELNGLKSYDALLLGAIGDPRVKPGILEKDILLKIRFGLDQYINLRPVKLYPNVETPLKNVTESQIDYVVVRENTGGLYTGFGGQAMAGTTEEVASQSMVYTYHQVKRCVDYAFKTAVKRHQSRDFAGLTPEEKEKGYKGKLTLVGKSNVLTYVFDLWNRVIAETATDYPTVAVDYVHVDACCIYMLECPERFDVIVTTNMFGDIITDLAAVTQGGMGIAPGGNINPEGVSMFEPIGGTAPAFTGLNQINPLAAIGAGQLLLDHLGYTQAAESIQQAIQNVTPQMTSMRAGQMGHSTSEVGDMVCAQL